MSNNRRSATRHSVSVAVTLEVDDQTHECEMQNLSLGGAHVITDRRFPLGTEVNLRFRVATHDQPIAVGAKVRWSTEDGIGVQFDGLRAREVWSLNKFFETL